MIPFFSSWLSVENYGTFDLLITYVALLIPIITFSSADGIFRLSLKDDNLNNKKNYITNGLFIDIINLFIFIFLLLIFTIITNWNYLVPFSLLLIGTTSLNFLEGFTRAIKRLDIYSFVNIIVTIFIAIFVTIGIQIFDLGLLGILYGYAIGYLTGVILIAYISKLYKYINFKVISKKKIIEIVSYSYPLIANNISWWVISVADRILIFNVLGAAINGIYAVANKITNLSASVFSMFNISWQQKASELKKKDERKRYFNKIYNRVFSMITLISAGLISVNFILYDFIFDIKYSDGRLYTPILITATIFLVLSTFYGGIQISLMRTKDNASTTIFGAITNLLLNLIFINFFGLFAASISTLISYLVTVYLRRKKLNKEYSFKLKRSNLLLFAIYIYIFCMSYLEISLFLSIVNIFLIIFLFIYTNRHAIIRVINMVLKR